MAGYLKIGDIVGGSTEPDHVGWINLMSFSQGLNRPMKAGGFGETRHKGSVVCGDVHCVKEMDSSTAKLIAACCAGTIFDKVFIDVTTSVGAGKRVPYFQWEMDNVIVTSYDVSGQGNSASVATESISMNYEVIKWTYDKMGVDGKTKGKIDAKWNVEAGRP